MRGSRLPGGALANCRFNENDIAFGIVGIGEIERIHRELAYACAELGANRFGHRVRANITGGFNCVEDVEDFLFTYLRTSPIPACSLSPSLAERMRAMLLLGNELALSAAFVLTLVVHPETESHVNASFLTSISRSPKRLYLADLL